mmetsp:Transcript_12177/g.20358  ORF Transcript_12177/g.20358 Transcript_12177/m.20358 type:complete len:81 (+) Transcript_12177:493-735(+)
MFNSQQEENTKALSGNERVISFPDRVGADTVMTTAPNAVLFEVFTTTYCASFGTVSYCGSSGKTQKMQIIFPAILKFGDC